MVDDILVVDCHNHANYCYHGYSQMIEDMDRNNIAKTWILTCEIPMGDWEHQSANSVCIFTEKAQMPFENAVRYKEKCPERFVLGYSPDPRDPFALDKLDAAVHTYGVKVCGEWKHRVMFDNPDAVEIYKYCGEKGIPVLVHLDYPVYKEKVFPRKHYWYGGGIGPFERALEQCPETVFIGHAPGFWRHFYSDDKVPELMRKYLNLYCDISAGSGYDALSRDLEFTKTFIAEFSDRILHGRDNFTSIHQSLIRNMDISEEAKRKILGENAMNLLCKNK